MSRSRTGGSPPSAEGLPRGAEEIDASGRLVTPGFVDIHTHYDGQAVWDSHLAPSAIHGVTTAVMGNCGVGFAPCPPGHRDKLIELMEGVEDIPAPVLPRASTSSGRASPNTWRCWTPSRATSTSARWSRMPRVRVYVMGERALALENANQGDIAEMRRLVAEAVKAGAFGFSTSPHHQPQDAEGRRDADAARAGGGADRPRHGPEGCRRRLHGDRLRLEHARPRDRIRHDAAHRRSAAAGRWSSR